MNRTTFILLDVKAGLISSNQTWFDVNGGTIVKMNFNEIYLKSLKMNKNHAKHKNCQQTQQTVRKFAQT